MILQTCVDGGSSGGGGHPTVAAPCSTSGTA